MSTLRTLAFGDPNALIESQKPSLRELAFPKETAPKKQSLRQLAFPEQQISLETKPTPATTYDPEGFEARQYERFEQTRQRAMAGPRSLGILPGQPITGLQRGALETQRWTQSPHVKRRGAMQEIRAEGMRNASSFQRLAVQAARISPVRLFDWLLLKIPSRFAPNIFDPHKEGIETAAQMSQEEGGLEGAASAALMGAEVAEQIAALLLPFVPKIARANNKRVVTKNIQILIDAQGARTPEVAKAMRKLKKIGATEEEIGKGLKEWLRWRTGDVSARNIGTKPLTRISGKENIAVRRVGLEATKGQRPLEGIRRAEDVPLKTNQQIANEREGIREWVKGQGHTMTPNIARAFTGEIEPVVMRATPPGKIRVFAEAAETPRADPIINRAITAARQDVRSIEREMIVEKNDEAFYVLQLNLRRTKEQLERLMGQQRLVTPSRTDLPQMTSVPNRPVELPYAEGYQGPTPLIEGTPAAPSGRVPIIQGEPRPTGGIEIAPGLKRPQGSPKPLKPIEPIPEEQVIASTKAEAVKVKNDAKDITLDAVRTRKAENAKNSIVANRWEEIYTERELEDAGALIEGISNLRVGKKPIPTGRLKKLKNQATVTYDRMREEVNLYLKGAGEAEYIKYLEDYLPHFYKGGKKNISAQVGGWVRRNSPSAKHRRLLTLEEAIKPIAEGGMGLEPITQNIAKLTRQWSQINWQVATTKKLVHDVKKLKIDGLPVMMAEKRPSWHLSDNAAVRAMFGGRAAYIHPEAWKPLRNVLDKPLSGNFIATLEFFNAFAKRFALSLSFFHHGALTESAVGALGWKGLPVPTMRSAKTGKLTRPHVIGLEMLEKSDFYVDMVRHGVQLGDPLDLTQLSRFTKALEVAEANMRNSPFLAARATVTGMRKTFDWFDRTLWHRYHRGLKAMTYHTLLEDNLLQATTKGYSIKQVKEEIAAVVNNMYGGQEWEAFMRLGPKGMQVLHWTQLAPDWTISNIKIAAEPVRKSWLRRKVGRKYWRNMALFAFVETQGMNYLLNRKPSWENEVNHEFDVDVSNIVRNFPWMDEQDKKKRYYVQGFKQVREAFGWLGFNRQGHWDPSEALKQIGRKASPGLQMLVEQVTAQSIGGFPMEWQERAGYRPRNTEMAWMRSKAIGRKFLPFSLSGNNFAFTLPLSKGMTPYKFKRAMVTALRYFAEPTLVDKLIRNKYSKDDLREIIKDYQEAGAKNALDVESLTNQAFGIARKHFYDIQDKALVAEEMDKFDEAGEKLKRLGATDINIDDALQRRRDLRQIQPTP